LWTRASSCQIEITSSIKFVEEDPH